MLDAISAGIDVTNYIDFRLVVFLLCVGFLVKHFVTKFPNKFIPYLLIAISLAYMFIIMNGVNTNNILNAIVDGIISASVAIGLHSSGKGIINILRISNVSDNISTDSIDEVDEEPVDEDSEDVED